MDDRGLSLRVGAVVIAAASTFTILVLAFGSTRDYFKDMYTVTVRFPQAPGVEPGTPVRKSGVKVGHVSKVELQRNGDVMVTLELDPEMPIKASERPRISTGSLVTGDAIIEFVPDPTDRSTELLDRNIGFLGNGTVMGDPFEVLVSLETRMTDTFGSIQRAAAEIETAAGTAGNILKGLEGLGENREQFVQVAQKAELALDQFSQTMMTIEEVFGDAELRGRLRTALDDLPTVMNEAKLLFSEGRQAVQGFQTLSSRIDSNLANLENFTEPLGERGPQIVENIDDSIRRLDEVFEQLVFMTSAINQQKGTIGKLVYDAEAYDNLNRLIREADELVNVQVKAILDNVYIATDKIARDPGQVGVRGALDRSPSNKKTILNIPR